MNLEVKTCVPSLRSATAALERLRCAKLQSSGAAFDIEQLSSIIRFIERWIIIMEADINNNTQNSAVKSLLERAIKARDSNLGFSITEEEVVIWSDYIDSGVGRSHGEATIEKYMYYWIFPELDSKSTHPLNNQRDLKEDYSQGLRYECGKFPLFGKEDASVVLEIAKPYYFHLIATVERLQECAKKRRKARLSHHEVAGINFLLYHFRSRTEVDLSESFAEANRRVDTAAQRNEGLVMPRLDVRAISISFASMQISTPLTKHKNQKGSANAQARQKEASHANAPLQIKTLLPSLSKLVSTTMQRRLVNFQAIVKQGEEVSVDETAADEILTLCRNIFALGIVPVNWTRNALHPQVTALRKLIKATKMVGVERMSLSTEESRSISNIFDVTPQPLRQFMEMDESVSSAEVHATSSNPPASEHPSNNTEGRHQDEYSAEGQSDEGHHSKKTESAEKKFENFINAASNKLDAIMTTLYDDIEQDLGLLPQVPDFFCRELALVENGIVNLRMKGQKSLKEADRLMEKRVSAADAEISALKLKLAEATRSAGEDHTKLKVESDRKISMLENQLHLTQSEYDKFKTATNKQQGSLNSMLSLSRKEASELQRKCDVGMESEKISGLDYDSLSQQFKATNTEQQGLSASQKLKITALEKELAVLRSHRTNPAVEKDVVARSVASAVAIKEAELERKHVTEGNASARTSADALAKKQAELDSKEQELDFKQRELDSAHVRFQTSQEGQNEAMKDRELQISELKESLAVIENISARGQGFWAPDNLS
ncbi:hypothetical protein WAI453_006275 [Rhynchosporium graminicola]|uniref:Uncharacterized protein n=1 Tax=Rhynchosporium graminicola TaxID=2792576 RepID=A0A1E1L729_9HELO|nr:uncharacterized protein RCO7_03313 [Rhynchosporium commune]